MTDAPLTGTVAVRGLAPLVTGFAGLARGGVSKPLLAELPKLAQPVADEARTQAGSIAHGFEHRQVGLSEETVDGFQAGRRGIAAVVRQRAKKSSGRTIDVHRFGSFQMRKILLPALRTREAEVIENVEAFVDDVVAGALR